MIKRIFILTIIFIMLLSTTVSAHTESHMADGLIGAFDWTGEQREQIIERFGNHKEGDEFTESQKQWIRINLVERIQNLGSVFNNRDKTRTAPLEEFLAENEEYLKSVELGLVEEDFNYGYESIKSINFLVTSTKRRSKEYWDMGKEIHFDIGDVSLAIGVEDRITYEWWTPMWEAVDPGLTIPHIYKIDMTLLELALAERLGISDYEAQQILHYPYNRQNRLNLEPKIVMRTDIDIFDPPDDSDNTEDHVPIYSFNTKDKATQQSIYNNTHTAGRSEGIWFSDEAIADIQSRFQDIEIEIPPINITVHHVDAIKADGAGEVEFPSQGAPNFVGPDGTYEIESYISSRTITLSDYEQLTISSDISEFEDSEAYEFLGSVSPSLITATGGRPTFIDYIPGRMHYALPRLEFSQDRYYQSTSSSVVVDALGDFDVYFFYKRDKLPDFQAVSIDPGTEYAMPGETYNASATFKLKEEGYFWPHEGDIKITHNDTTVLEEKNVVFQLGETKSYDFTWTGTEDDSKICIEIWPSIPTISQPRPGERLEDAYPDDNKLCIDVENGEVTLTVLTDPNISSVGTTTPEPGIYKVERDSVIDLSATPNNNWEFVRWKGDISSTNPDTSVTMDESKIVIAEFARKQFKLTIKARPPEGGTTNPGVGTHYVDAGSTITIRAYPGNDYEFISWGGDGTGTSPTTSVYMNSNKHVIAYFQMDDPPPQSDPKGLGNPILVE